MKNPRVPLTFNVYAKNSHQSWRSARSAEPIGTVVATSVEQAQKDILGRFVGPVVLDLKRGRK